MRENARNVRQRRESENRENGESREENGESEAEKGKREEGGRKLGDNLGGGNDACAGG